MRVSPDGLVGNLVLTPTFAFLALATYRAGLARPGAISVIEGVLVFGVTLAPVTSCPRRSAGRKRSSPPRRRRRSRQA
jgi:hypothetical protein